MVALYNTVKSGFEAHALIYPTAREVGLIIQDAQIKWVWPNLRIRDTIDYRELVLPRVTSPLRLPSRSLRLCYQTKSSGTSGSFCHVRLKGRSRES